ncbi:MAG: IS1634 family transposase, partial [Betaproteobacteria bacterium]|nr:IS1634 family transposase [Betaproteobacteria bacterium]
VKLTKSGPRSYVQLVEAYRDETGRPKQRTVATLGRLDQMGDSMRSMHDGLSRLLGLDVGQTACNGTASFESSRALGDIWALTQLWEGLGLHRLGAAFRQSSRHRVDLEALLRVMVFNRLCDADSKLGVLRWVQTVSFPGLEGVEKITHQQLLRTMDALIEHQALLEDALVEATKPLIDQARSVVFYDMTTIRSEGLSVQDGELRQHGMSKEGLIARQFMLGLVQTDQGVPLYHEVFEGNTAEVGTLQASLEKVMKRFAVERVIAVADRGLLSIDNLEALQAMRLPNGKPLEFILAVPGRRYAEFAELLAPVNAQAAQSQAKEIVAEASWEGLRLVIAHDRDRAMEQSAKRDETIAKLEAQAAQWVGKLDAQDAGLKARGRALSDGGVRARFYHAVAEAHLRRIIRVDLKSELFTYDIDQRALALARAMDGKLLLVTNANDLTATEVVAQYKALADIERSFKVLKSEIELGPVHHRLPDRIRAHAMICFVALILQRLIRTRLRAQPVENVVSPERALGQLRRIQTHRVVMPNQRTLTGISSIDAEQAAIFNSLGVKKPTANERYANL